MSGTTLDSEYFRKKIKSTANDEDPIVAWIEYFNFIKKAKNKKEIFNVLKGCTTTFRNCPKYKDDVRYIQVWLAYVRFLLSLPYDIFTQHIILRQKLHNNQQLIMNISNQKVLE